MEFVVNPRVTSDLGAALLSALLGMSAGFLAPIVVAVGLIVGMILRRHYILAPAVSQNSGAAKL